MKSAQIHVQENIQCLEVGTLICYFHFKEVVERMEVSKNTVDSGGSVEVLWSGFRDCMTEAAEHVCGRTKGRQVHHETWWWNDEVDRAVSEKT